MRPRSRALVRSFSASFAFGAVAAAGACVPSGSAPPYDGGTSSTTTAPSFKPSVNVMAAPFEDTFDRPDAGDMDAAALLLPTPGDAAPGVKADARDAGDAAHEGALAAMASRESAVLGEGADGGSGLLGPLHLAERSNLGPNWTQSKTTAWRIENGRLCGQNARNHGVWLNKVLPVNARIEFDAIALSDDGDLKTEVWGDGQSAATTVSYNNATSYLAILGGWHNTLHVLARINEHGSDRKEIRVDKESDDPRQKPVVKGQVYRFKVERTDGKTVRMFVDGVEYHSFVDPSPLAGAGHDHFGFNEWEAKTCYDNVKVTPL